MLQVSNDIHSIEEIESQISGELEDMRAEVIHLYSVIKGRSCSVHSLHGTISINKSGSLDLIKAHWLNPKDYISDWLKGLKDDIILKDSSIIQDMITNEKIRKYIFKYLERDFYRHYRARVRIKPQENLWSIWFGNSTLHWGILISPRFDGESWGNKPADIRKVEFDYWTVGHILRTGLVDPENNKIIRFKKIENLLDFYESILKRVSSSIYEKEVYDFYCRYLLKSTDIQSEPFLIPEFRYAGLEKKHKYRLDFTILNSNTGERIGFELSPQSTHLYISGITSKTQTQINTDLSKQWNKEMDKRNSYFQEFGISTITFTDKNLKDMNGCLGMIEYYLSKRTEERKSINDLVMEIINLK